MKRRKFLTIAGLGSALVAVFSLKFFTTSFEDAAAAVIRNELSFLKLDVAGVSQFVRDYSARRDMNYKLAVKGYSLLKISASNSGKIHQLVSNYLLSTDFFQHNMDESRTLQYVGLYDPYKRACAHPFSHLQQPGNPS